MRIAIAHNNPAVLQLFEQLIKELGLTTCWSTDQANEVLNKCEAELPDLLLIQQEITGSPCAGLVRELMQHCPTTIIVTSSCINTNSSAVFESMSAGALDAFSEPSTDSPESINDFKIKISNIRKLHRSMNSSEAAPAIRQRKKHIPMIAIGSSTGGPAALLTILRQLPHNLQAIVVIIQHLDDQFSQGMADWLRDQSGHTVEIAQDGRSPQPGHIYMAGTNDHLIINLQRQFEYTAEPVDYPYRPSVDVFFESAVTHWPEKLVGVLLTGMGRDGAKGLLSFYNRGMMTIAQDEASCAVYGMPKAACELNAVKHQLDIHDIATKIIKSIKDVNNT